MSLHLVAPGAFHDAYDRIRSEHELPRAFAAEALEEAFGSEPERFSRRDLREVPFVAIDPPGAADLDQALFIDERSSGFRVWYAIADVGAFVTPGGALDAASRSRGVTMYFPDRRIPLHPRILSEERASLLPERDRPAVVWRLDLDENGEVEASHFERAIIRVADAISYQQAQASLTTDRRLQLLEAVGRRRSSLEAQRGGISLDIAGQRVSRTGAGYLIEYERTLPVEHWNAQISILTGIVAAHTLVDAGMGIVRTLPSPRPDDLTELRLRAAGLGIEWPDSTSYADLLRSLDNDHSRHVAFKYAALRTLRGAGYAPVAQRPSERLVHGAIGDLYAHVTAPLRRLGDRHVNELLLSIHADEAPPAWAVEAASDWLAERMVEARALQATIDREVIDHTEATLLTNRLGDTFGAIVVRTRNGRARVQIAEPAVVADIDAGRLSSGDRVVVRLEAADPVAGEVLFSHVAR